MESHLDSKERSQGNKRNGKGSKRIKTSSGMITIDTPQDRHSSFEPQIVKKRETVLADNLAPQIIGLYGLGMSFRDISNHIKEMYDYEISAATLSEITDRVIPKVKEWQNRALDEVYPIVWLDAIYYKVRDEGRVVSRAVYNILAVNRYGKKEVIGMYVSETEGAKFWLSVLTDLRNRGVKDILIASTDNLKGFSEAILSPIASFGGLYVPEELPQLGKEFLEKHPYWDLGYNRTLEYLKKLEEEKMIRVDRTKRPHEYSLFNG